MKKVKEINILWIVGIIVGIYHIFMKLDFGDDIYYLNLAFQFLDSKQKYISIIMFVWEFFSIFNTFSCIVYTAFT